MKPGNQGRDIEGLLNDVPYQLLVDAAKAGVSERDAHPNVPSCPCVSMEVLAVLYEAGYRVIKEEANVN